ncbi:MAG TPA: glycosyltransferase family 2 protein [Acidimicrobiales bacterium]|nr:glycosyltransferase family 2 protein [Acidimicrobiales bacterium]
MSAPPAGSPLELSVVLPAHNEVALLGSTVTNLVTGLEARRLSYEIIVVENGSSDGTLRLARLLEAQLDSVRVLTRPVGDYGAALKTGLEAARGDVVVSFDVDYYDLAFLDTARRLLDEGGAALVLASKRAPGARDRRPLARRLLTACFSAALRYGLGLRASDAHGMKAVRRAELGTLLERCTMRGSLFDVELVLRAEAAGLPVAEVPASVVERRPPRSAVWRRTAESLVGLARLAARRRREARREQLALRRAGGGGAAAARAAADRSRAGA